eukprot:195586-Pyramimonas_sp.AAC.1
MGRSARHRVGRPQPSCSRDVTGGLLRPTSAQLRAKRARKQARENPSAAHERSGGETRSEQQR